MNSLTRSILPLLLVCVLASFCAPARADGPIATEASAAAHALFDRAADAFSKDPISAKPLFARAAAEYERLLDRPLSQSARARLLTNAGAAHQLAGDLGRAVLDLRRADLLSPATPNLQERLTAARTAVHADAVILPSSPTAIPPAAHDADLSDAARDLALSAPRLWLWRIAAIGYVCLWSALLIRLLIPAGRAWRPALWIVVPVAALVALSTAGLAAAWFRDSAAATQAVIVRDTIGRSEPDDLTGSPSSPAPLKPGIEVRILDQRTGGDGRPWIRVEPIDAAPAPDERSIWIPESAAARILEPQTR